MGSATLKKKCEKKELGKEIKALNDNLLVSYAPPPPLAGARNLSEIKALNDNLLVSLPTFSFLLLSSLELSDTNRGGSISPELSPEAGPSDAFHEAGRACHSSLARRSRRSTTTSS